MRSLRFLLPVLVLGIMAFTPHATFAAETSALNAGWSLIPEQCLCDADHNTKQPGVDSAPDFGCVGYVIARVMNLMFSLGIVIFVLVASYSGFLFMASSVNPSGKEKAKSMLTNAGVGLFIALGAWLMVDFIMDSLYNEAWGPWESILDNKDARACLVVTTPPAGSVATTPTGSGGGVTAEPGTTPTTGGGATSGNATAVRSQLSAAGISVNKAECPSGTRYQDVSGGCTSVGGLASATISQAKEIAGACGGYTITGGNELGHSEGTESHSSGHKFDASTSLTSCIQQHTTSRTATFGAEQRTDSCGNVYTRETNPAHWDINVRSVCSAAW